MGNRCAGELQVKVAFCVVKGDTLHNFLQAGFDVGVFAVFHPIADEVAHDPAEIVVPGVAEEGTGIGEHTDEIAQQAQIARDFI